MRFLVPSGRTDLEAARRDLVEAMKSYLESARVAPGELAAPEEIFEIAILRLVRRHAMAVAPDAARYLKAVLTAEAAVKELDPAFDLTAHENRFFGRLMGIEMAEALNVRAVGQWLLDARVRAERLFDAIESLREAPVRLAPVVRQVRRRVQAFTALSGLAWVTLMAAMWMAGDGGVPAWYGYRPAGVAVAGVIVSLLLLGFAIRQVRRLPDEVGPAPPAGPYPRRLR
jgi:predicted unusual protein kinase regulating ubiquinone biosynthesis (AarF/ABC1/UbiB family)